MSTAFEPDVVAESPDSPNVAGARFPSVPHAAPMPDDHDPRETAEWLESLEYVLETAGPERISYLLAALQAKALREGINVRSTVTTPFTNTIPTDRQPAFPGDRAMERRIKSIVRWNAAAMVLGGNKRAKGIGGHISTYASAATLYEVAFNHFFRGPDEDGSGDQIYFQGHASPGIYSRAFLEGRLTKEQMLNFRRELAEGGGLSSYPHPWLMPTFWQFPTVSMGLGPIFSIYQARFNQYLTHRGLKDVSKSRVWAFLGDGECDEPESLGAISLASREKMGHLTWVINCNLQRLDGPVRGNGSIIQELEGIFRGAGWNVIKVVWGSDWDDLLAADHDGLLVKRLGEIVDGQYQKYVVSDGNFIRHDLFGKYPELLERVKDMTDEQIKVMRRGGHDPLKVYAAYKAATESKDRPTVILAKTIKGYGLGAEGEGLNTAHNTKEFKKPESMITFRDRFNIPLTDEQALKCELYLPAPDSPEMKYLHERRQALGGYVPQRSTKAPKIPAPDLSKYKKHFADSGEREPSTTMAFVALLSDLMKDKTFGKNIVPIVPDESRTFGLDPLFSQVGIYASTGQLYEPVDKKGLMYYKESRDGQILQEGINEAGGIASFIAAGTCHATHGVNMIPLYIYYSMFGFQRVGDQIWAAADLRCRGFLIGGTSGKTTLNGEGLQHEDGHSHLFASAIPNCMAYDPTYAYETAAIVLDGIRRMYTEQEDVFYYVTVHNENYAMPAMPEGAHEGILKGLYKLKFVDAGKGGPKVHLFGSGSILREVLRGQEILATKYGISSQVWSATSYKCLARDCEDVQRWNMLHPGETPRKSYLQTVLEAEGPIDVVVASSDNVRAVPGLIAPHMTDDYYILGCDGFGRSETRPNLRRFFEVDGEHVALATLHRLARQGKIDASIPVKAVGELGIDPNLPNPVTR